MSHTGAASRADSVDLIASGYEPPSAMARRLVALPNVARTHCALVSSATYLGRRVSKSMILAQVGVMRMSTICL